MSKKPTKKLTAQEYVDKVLTAEDIQDLAEGKLTAENCEWLAEADTIRPGLLRRIERKLGFKRHRGKPPTQEQIDAYNQYAREQGMPDWPEK